MAILNPRRRREEIVRLATTSGLATVVDLAETFGVSASTVRRDLAQLEAQRQLARTYGGAMAHYAHAESSLRQRIGEAFEAKQAIARWAANRVEPGESILLDAGSTVAALAHELRNRSHLAITTTSLTALNELSGSEDLTVHCLGGTLRKISQGLVGPIAETVLEHLSFDRAFLGADSVDAERGICEADLQQTRLKELMAQRAEHVYVLVHGEKLGRRPFHAWARMPIGWTLVTTAAQADVEPFLNRGVTVINLPVTSR